MDISEVLLDSLTGRLFLCLKLASGTSYTKTPKMYAKKTHMIMYIYIYMYIYVYIYIHISNDFLQFFS